MRAFLKRKARPLPPNILLAVIFVALLVALGWLLFKQFGESPKITDYKSCVAADQPILDSYPQQCTYNGQSFINPEQIQPKSIK